MYAGFPTSQDLNTLSRPPRKVVRRHGLPVPARCALFLLFPHVWIGMALLWAFINVCAMTLLGQTRQATVTSRDTQTTKANECQIDYVYNDRGGRHADHATLGAGAYKLYPPGASIQIRSVRIFGHSTSKPASKTYGVFSLMALGFFVILWNGFLLLHFFSLCLSPLFERQLLRKGEAVMSRITDKTSRGKKSGVDGLAYVFTDSDGHTQDGTMAVRRNDHEFAKIGDEVLVFYDPVDPKLSALYAYSQYALREWREYEGKQHLRSC